MFHGKSGEKSTFCMVNLAKNPPFQQLDSAIAQLSKAESLVPLDLRMGGEEMSSRYKVGKPLGTIVTIRYYPLVILGRHTQMLHVWNIYLHLPQK